MHLRLAPLAILACVGAASAAFGADKGFEIMARPGYGSAGAGSPIGYQDAPVAGGSARFGDPGAIWSGSSTPWGGGFRGEALVGYRFIPMLSVGLGAGLRSASGSDPGDGSTSLKRSAFDVGPYVRLYLPMVPVVEPWISVGVRYVGDTQSYSRPTLASVGGTATKVPTDWTLEHHGVAFPITVGVDYPILPMLSVGPSFELAPVVSAGGCSKQSYLGGAGSGSFCTDSNPRFTKASGYTVWSIGLDVRLTL